MKNWHLNKFQGMKPTSYWDENPELFREREAKTQPRQGWTPQKRRSLQYKGDDKNTRRPSRPFLVTEPRLLPFLFWIFWGPQPGVSR